MTISIFLLTWSNNNDPFFDQFYHPVTKGGTQMLDLPAKIVQTHPAPIFHFYLIFSSPEPKAQRRAYRILMVRRPSVRQSLTISNIFFFKTACPIKAKFYVEPPWVGGTKVCSQHLGHMTKMAATPI